MDEAVSSRDQPASNVTAPRVLVLSTYYHPVVGGVETHTRQIVRALHAEGFGIAVVTKRLGEGDEPPVVDGVPVTRVAPRGPRAGWAKWVMIPFATVAMLRLHREFDVVYCPDYRGIGLAALIAGRLLDRPVVLETGVTGILSCANWDPALRRLGVDGQGWLGRLLKWPMQRLYRSANAYPCITREIEREALASGVPPDRVHYLPYGVDLRRFRPATIGEREALRAEVGWPPDRTIVLYVARLSVEKGILDLLDAWRHIDDATAVLVVVGPDMAGHHLDAGPAARRMVVEAGLEGRVVFHGPTSDPAPFFRAADIFVQPSHWEASPAAVVEAMASRLPVVASRVGGMAEYLVDGANALFCEPKAPATLVGPLDRVISDASLRARLAAAARETAEREFDADHLHAKYAKLFRDLAGR